MNYSHPYLTTSALAAVMFTAISLPALVSGATETPTGSVFVPIIPCRLVDTRATTGMAAGFGAPSLLAKTARTFVVPNSRCAILNAVAYSANFVVVVPTGKTVGWLAAWPDDTTWPGTVVLNAIQGGIIGNGAVVAAGADGGIQVMSTDNTDLVIDINGYYLAGGAGVAGPLGPMGPIGPIGLQGAAGVAGTPGGAGAPGTSGVGANTTLVSTTGVPVTDGATLVGAMTAACAQLKPWLVKIGPGTYDVTAASLRLCPNVDVEGSGEDVTIVQSQAASTVDAQSMVDSVGELRSITIVNNAATGASMGASMGFGAWSFRNVTLTATAIAGQAATGIFSGRGYGIMDHVTSTATSDTASVGIDTAFAVGKLTVRDSAITATGAGANNTGIKANAPLWLLNSLVNSGLGTDIHTSNDSAKVYGSVLLGAKLECDSATNSLIAASEVAATSVLSALGSFKCVASFTPAGIAVTATCTP